MGPRRTSVWLLALAGVALGHVVGYGAAHPENWVDHLALEAHAYLPGLLAVVVPLGIIAALIHSIRNARALGSDEVLTVRGLAGLQVLGFGMQEAFERLADGVSPAALMPALLAERGVAFGLVAQVLVAAALVAAVRWTARVVRSVLAAGGRLTSRTPHLPRLLRPAPVAVAARAVGIVPVRGPPVVSI